MCESPHLASTEETYLCDTGVQNGYRISTVSDSNTTLPICTRHAQPEQRQYVNEYGSVKTAHKSGFNPRAAQPRHSPAESAYSCSNGTATPFLLQKYAAGQPEVPGQAAHFPWQRVLDEIFVFQCIARTSLDSVCEQA
jgi:hypothetical protein